MIDNKLEFSKKKFTYFQRSRSPSKFVQKAKRKDTTDKDRFDDRIKS